MGDLEPLNRNPGSRKWAANDSHETRRGYHFKDAGGRWRTPDGRHWANGAKAERANTARHSHLRAIDLTNLLRSQGVDAKLKDVKAALKGSEESRHAMFEAIYDEYPDADLEDYFDDDPWGDTP